MDIVGGWLLLYLCGSIPVLLFYAAGLSGWVLDYPMWLFIGIFVLFLIPLVLLIMKLPSAPAWNIALVWAVAGLITARVAYGILQMERGLQSHEALIMASAVLFAVAWAGVWTWYFLVSKRVAETFS